jgi:hypothetical protein
VLPGGLKDGASTGTTVAVDAAGMATIALPTLTAIAIHVGQKK